MKGLIRTTLSIAVLMPMLWSCSKSTVVCPNPDGQRIQLSSEVTLATQPRLQDLQIEQGQDLSLFVTRYNNPASELYNNVNIIANGQGGFSSSTIMYYPIDGGNIDLFAIHPYSGSASLQSPVTFSVAGDQTVQTNYLNSDLLHALKVNQARTASAVELVFSHKLSKLDITVISNDLDLADLNTVAILNTLPSTTIVPHTGVITAASGTTVPISAYGVAASPTERAQVSNISAIVVPQTIATGTQLFRINVGAQEFTYTTTGAFEFTEGNEHAITLTITGGQISLESSIAPWGPGGSIGGEATPE